MLQSSVQLNHVSLHMCICFTSVRCFNTATYVSLLYDVLVHMFQRNALCFTTYVSLLCMHLSLLIHRFQSSVQMYYVSLHMLHFCILFYHTCFREMLHICFTKHAKNFFLYTCNAYITFQRRATYAYARLPVWPFLCMHINTCLLHSVQTKTYLCACTEMDIHVSASFSAARVYYVYTNKNICTCIFIYVYIHIYIHMYLCVYKYIYVYMQIYTYIYVYIPVHIYKICT